jgi:hypothetical protein
MHFAEGTIMLHLVARLYLGRVGDAANISSLSGISERRVQD